MLHILLVEDVAQEREMISTALERRGVRVTAVANDATAYAALREAGRHGFHGLITDIDLGAGTTGFDVARAARVIHPELPVVYMTAYDVETRPHAVPDSLSMKKPMRLADLADRVLEYLGRNADTSAEWNVRGERGEASAG